MTRIARVVIADHPHHITQRCNSRQAVFLLKRKIRGELGVCPPNSVPSPAALRILPIFVKQLQFGMI